MLDPFIVMIIVWSVVIAVALLVEFFTYDMVSVWFSAGALGALILAACEVHYMWQVFVFFMLPVICLIFLRKIVVKFVQGRTTPTNLDVNVGKVVKLLRDVTEGRSEIKILDVIWTVSCNDELKAGDKVEIIDMAGNRYLVKAATPEAIEAAKAQESKSKTDKKNTKAKDSKNKVMTASKSSTADSGEKKEEEKK